MKIWIEPKEWRSGRRGTLIVGIVGFASVVSGALLLGGFLEPSIRNAVYYALLLGGLYCYGAAVGMSFWLIPPKPGSNRSKYMKYTDDEAQS